MQKLDNARVIYETLLKKRCADSHWSKTKKLMVECGFPLDKDGFTVLINLRKVSPRYFSKYVEIKESLTAQGEEILTFLEDGITGEEFITILKNTLEISPNQSTVSRWFKNVGGFKLRNFYSKSIALPLLAVALIYKAKVYSKSITKLKKQ